MPQSFLCLTLKPMMDEGIKNNLPFICDKKNILNGGDFIAGTEIIGASKNNPHIIIVYVQMNYLYLRIIPSIKYRKTNKY